MVDASFRGACGSHTSHDVRTGRVGCIGCRRVVRAGSGWQRATALTTMRRREGVLSAMRCRDPPMTTMRGIARCLRGIILTAMRRKMEALPAKAAETSLCPRCVAETQSRCVAEPIRERCATGWGS